MAVDPTLDVLDQPLELHKGDSDEYLFTVTEPNLADPDNPTPVRLDQAVDGTQDRYAILRWTVKRSPASQDQAEALLAKDFQSGTSEFRYLDQTVAATVGQAEALVDPDDTTDTDEPVSDDDEDPQHRHDLEINRQDEERAGASQVGTVSVTDGSNIVTGTATQFTKAKRLDIINLLDASNLLRPALITKIVSDTELEVMRTLWSTTGAPVSFEIRRNRRRTAAAGTFKLKTEVTSDA